MADIENPKRVVVVTAASGGIGRAVARAFGARHARVALLARGEKGLSAAADDVSRGGGTALEIPTDVADFDQVEAAAERVEKELDPIDVWVNVAFTSVFARFSDIEPGGNPIAGNHVNRQFQSANRCSSTPPPSGTTGSPPTWNARSTSAST